MRLNHLGFVTRDLGKAVDAYLGMGYEKVHDDVKHHVPKNMLVQRVRLGDTVVELMQAADPGKPSFADEPLDRSPAETALQHLCYDVDDIHKTFDELLATGEYTVHEPITSGVFQKNLIGFLRHRAIGLVEFFEWPKA